MIALMLIVLILYYQILFILENCNNHYDYYSVTNFKHNFFFFLFIFIYFRVINKSRSIFEKSILNKYKNNLILN